MNASFKPRTEMLEDRLVPASVVLAESTFDPEAFGQNIHAGLDYNIVGYAYAVNHNGNAVVAAGTGGLYGPDDGRARTAAETDDSETVFETDTRIEINSVSKIITTVAVLHLLESQGGDLDAALSTPIAEYLPSHWTIGDNVNLLTIRHLLTHTSGFVEDPSNAIGVNFENYGKNNLQNLRDLVEAGLPPPPADITLPDGSPAYDITLTDGSPAYDRSYNNANFSLLAKMIPYMLADADAKAVLDEFAANHPESADLFFGLVYSQYVVDNILSPCGIDNPSMAPTGEYPALGYDFATVETDTGTPQNDDTPFGGAFGWNLAALELAQFMNTLRHTNTLLSDTARSLMHSDDFLLGWSPDKGNMGPGPDHYVLPPVQDAFGAYYQHNGAGYDFRSQIVMFPGDVEAALAMNSFPPSIPNRFDFMRTAYHNAWSSLVIEGDEFDNEFVVRLNADDATRVDIITLNGGNEIVIASPAVDLLTSLQFRGLAGNDTFRIEDLPANTDLVLDGGGDNDTFVIGNTLGNSAFDYIFGNLAIVGGTGVDHLEVKDDNGIGDAYAITGIATSELTVDGIIEAANYTPGKMFQYGQIDELMLQANTDPNVITVTGITPFMTVDVYGGGNDDTFLVSDIADWVTMSLYGQGGADTFDVWNVGANATITVAGDIPIAPGSDDVLYLGQGDLDTIQGAISFDGAGGEDSVFLDDTLASTGRSFRINTGSIAADGFGGLTLVTPAEHLRLDGSARDDVINVESLSIGTDADLYGHDGSDVFNVRGISHNVDPVAGDVIIHGGDAMTGEPEMPAPEDDDQVYVFDNENPVAGAFTIDLDGDLVHGRLNKLGATEQPKLNVIYDQIERTYLHTDVGDNTITVLGAPWFNQVSVYAGGGQDKIDVETTPVAAPMQIFGEDGADAIRVSPTAQHLGYLHGPLVVDGGSALAGELDVLAVYDSQSGVAGPYDLDSTSLARSGSAGITFTTVEDLVVSLSDANNEITVFATAPGTNVFISGNAGDDTLTAGNLASAVVFDGGGDVDQAILVGTAADDLFTASGDTLMLGGGALTTSTEQREVHGLVGADRLTLRGTAGTNEAFQLWPSTTPNAGTAKPNPYTAITYESVEEMQVEGNAGDVDTLQVNGQTTAGVLGGGVYHDRFNINLGAAGTSKDPVLVLGNDLGQTLLTLTDWRQVSAPKINGLLGADIFNVQVLATGTQSRHVQLDGGGQPFGLKGDQLNVSYVERGAKVTRIPTSPKSGKISIDYTALVFAIEYLDMEATQLLPT